MCAEASKAISSSLGRWQVLASDDTRFPDAKNRDAPAACQITSLRCRSNCQQMALAAYGGRIVEKTLAENPVAAPFLQRDLVEAARLAGLVGHFEVPVNGDAVTLDGG